MVIVIAGIKRSGSTLLYNMVRLVLEAQGVDVSVSGQNYVISGGTDLIKIHPFRRKLAHKADHVFVSDRDMYDLKSSLENFTGEGQPWDRITDMYKHLQRWSLFSDLDHYFEYPQLTRDKPHCIKRIAALLEADVDTERVLLQLNTLRPPEKGQDPQTLLFHNHKST